MITFAQYLFESFNSSYPFQVIEDDDQFVFVSFKTEDGSDVRMEMSMEGLSAYPGMWNIEFSRDNRYGITEKGDAFRIFATVLKIIEWLIRTREVTGLSFYADKAMNLDSPNLEKNESRSKLYKRMVNRFSSKYGFRSKIKEKRDSTSFTLTR